jgi:hypothetical protein
LLGRQVERSAAADDEQIVESIVVEVSPRHAGPYILGQLRSAGTPRLAEVREAGQLGDIGEARLRRSCRELTSGIPRRISDSRCIGHARGFGRGHGLSRGLVADDGGDVGGSFPRFVLLRLGFLTNPPGDKRADQNQRS